MASGRGVQLNRYIAANTRKWRRRRGLTQEKVAELADLDLRHFQSIEQARENITVATLAAIADALDVRPSLLLRSAEMHSIRRGRPRAGKTRS